MVLLQCRVLWTQMGKLLQQNLEMRVDVILCFLPPYK